MFERMYAVLITDGGGEKRRLDFSKPELTVGRVNGNDIVLAKRNVSKQHARLSLEDEKAVVVDLNSTNGTWVNGRKITAPHPLKQGDKIYIADFIITLEGDSATAQGSRAPEQVSEPPPPPSAAPAPARSSIPKTSIPVRTSLPHRARTSRPKDPVATSLPPRIESRPTDEAELGTPAKDPLAELMRRLSKRLDIEDVSPEAMKDQDRWSAARAAIAETFLTMQKDGSVDSDVDMRQVAHTALHEIVGLGALDDVLSNEEIQWIVVSGRDRVLIDTGEGPRPTALSFSSAKALDIIARRLAAQCDRPLGDEPVFHGRLSFGPRVTILRPPLVSPGPLIEIRIDQSAALDQLCEDGWMSPEAAAHLRKATAECRNIAVLGPAGSGVSTLLSALCQELPEEENTALVEALPDLDVDRTKVVSFSAADAGLSMSQTIAHASRLRTDHLVLSDLTGAEVASALGVIGGREPGHLLGVHCATTSNAVEGLVLATSCGGTDRACAAQMIGSALHTIVAVERGSTGNKVSAIFTIEGHEAGDVSYESVPV
ncbi:MAG: ATPase, T2SS/T4P/T4SS family [Myxococcota bacterium]